MSICFYSSTLVHQHLKHHHEDSTFMYRAWGISTLGRQHCSSKRRRPWSKAWQILKSLVKQHRWFVTPLDYCQKRMASNNTLGFQPPLKQWVFLFHHHCLPKGFNHPNWVNHYFNGDWKPSKNRHVNYIRFGITFSKFGSHWQAMRY